METIGGIWSDTAIAGHGFDERFAGARQSHCPTWVEMKIPLAHKGRGRAVTLRGRSLQSMSAVWPYFTSLAARRNIPYSIW